jgi:hypothetical protein
MRAPSFTLGRGVLLLIVSSAIVAAAGCGSSPSGTPKCVRPSDCSGQLTCVEGYCVATCLTSKDCMMGKERCIVTSGGNTCEPPETTTCHFNSDCTSPLVCPADGQCRNQCEADRDCAGGQVCTKTTKLCADPTLDHDYDPTTMDFTFATDAGTADAPATSDGGGADARAMGDGGGADAREEEAGDGGADGGGEAGALCETSDAGLGRFLPSNFPATLTVPAGLAPYAQSDDATLDTDALTLTVAGADAGADGGVALRTAVVTLSNGNEAAIVFFDSYTLAAGATLTVTGQRALILAANDTLLIQGTIATAESPTNEWSGGGPPGPATAARAGVCDDDSENGGGAAGSLDANEELGGGGGGFCGPGGHGTGGAPPVDAGADAASGGPAGGQPYGNASLVPLVGGSSGGNASHASNDNHGGGAVELVAGSSLTIDLDGVIDMAGGGYGNNVSANGGGSGGAILLEAPSVTVRGTLAANGGAGSVLNGGFGAPGMASDQPTTEARNQGGQGSASAVIAGGDAHAGAGFQTAGGGGGAGRIRMNTGCGGTLKLNSGAIVSPGAGTTCTTSGTLSTR